MPITLFRTPANCVSEFLQFAGAALTEDFSKEQWTQEAVLFAETLSPMVERFIEDDQLENVGGYQKTAARELMARFVYFGLLTHCLCHLMDNRHKVSKLDLDSHFYLEWLESSIAARAFIFGEYNSFSQKIPSLFVEALIHRELEPFMKEIGLGMWKRAKNRRTFERFFGAGAALGAMSDLRTNKLPD